MKKTAVTIVLLIVSFITFLTSAFGWLSLHPVLPTKIDGSLIVGYFGGGTGEAGDPYILNESRHVYNLAWLQYTGRLNEKQEGGKIKQLYFKVTDDIDMSGLVIPPIGTKVHPFVGNFNGGGHVIHNFEVANVLGEGAITERPLSVVDMGDNASIVGFFGVVGDLDGSLKGLIAEEDEENKINAVYDLYLTNFIVNTITTESLIGLLAGYVNGQVENVGIGKSAIKIAERVKPLSSMSVLNTNRIFSLYSLLGYYDSTNVLWEKLPTGAELGGGDSGGEGAGFGGSINMHDFIRRLTYMYTENVARNATYPVSFYVGSGSYSDIKSYKIDYTSTTGQTSYLFKGTNMPLNVNKAAMFAGEKNYTYTSGNSSYNLLTTPYYEKDNIEDIDTAKNTGYIIGGGNNSIDAMVRTRLNTLAEGNSPGIYRSIGSATSPTATFSRSTFHCLTMVPSTDGTSAITYVVLDDFNTPENDTKVAIENVDGRQSETYAKLNLLKYESVVSGFSASMSDPSHEEDTIGKMLYAIRFNKGDINSRTKISAAHIAGETYSSYQVVEGSANFHLEEDGVVTTLAGTYNLANGTHTMFDLYKVERNPSGEITNATEITKIWTKTVNGKLDIQYNDNGSVANGYTCEYSSAVMKDLTEINAAYYFELPVQQGDYVLTSKGTNGAYLMYLDIGANGAAGGEEETPGEGGYEYGISGINFVDKNMPKTNSTFTTSIDDENYPVIVYRVAGTNASESGYNPLTAYYNREGANTMTMQYVDSNRHFTITRFPTTIDYGAPTRETSVPVLPEAVVNVRYVYKDERTNEQEAV